MKSFFSKLRRVAIGMRTGGALALAVMMGAVVLFPNAFRTEEAKLEIALGAFPDHDFAADVRALLAEKRADEAKRLTDFALSGDIPPEKKAELASLRKQAAAASMENIAKDAAWGFLSGKTDTMAMAGGSLASDMFLFGDVRDLTLWGFYRLTGDEDKRDDVCAALAVVGLATEFVDVADWAPAVLKIFRKAGALSEPFCRFLKRACDASIRARKLAPELASTFRSTKRLVADAGLQGAMTIFKHADDAKDLAVAARFAQAAPEATAAALRQTGKDGMELLHTLGKRADGAELLHKGVRKGPAGLRLVKDAAGKTRRLTRFGKMIRKGTFQRILGPLLRPFLRPILGGLAILFLTDGLGSFVFRRRHAQRSSKRAPAARESVSRQ